MMPQPNRKLFVLDTSVLIHDPNALHSFHEHDVVLPYVVLHEVDGLRKAPNGRGAAANAVFRSLETLRAASSTLVDAPLGPGLGTLTIYMPEDPEFPAVEDIPKSLRDDMIIRCAQRLSEQHPQVIMVSKDLGLRLKASVHGLQAEDYLRSKIKDWEHRYTGLHSEAIILPAAAGDELHAGTVPAPEGLLQNEFCYVEFEGHANMGRFLCRNKQGLLRPLPEKHRAIQGVKPLDDYQRMALDLLMDDDVKCVALLGVAGGGKTLLALAAGLEHLESGEHESILAIKPIVPVGRRDIGFLKGDKDEKLHSWLMPVFDNLRVLQMHRRNGLDLEMMRDNGQLQMESYTYLRGRTLHGYWVILDEMQNTTELEATTALSRMGEKTRCVVLADITQIDNPYVDAQSCGATVAVEKLKDSEMFGVAPLNISQRSEFAQLVAERMQHGQTGVA
ncbi:MAG: PhoH family protein [Armatimonadia bacterium]